MEFIDIFPTVILQTSLNNISIDEISQYKNFILNSDFVDNKGEGRYTQNQKLLDHHIFTNLKSYILNYSKNYLDQLAHEYEDLQISNSWGTYFSLGRNSNPHNHCNSYISGVFYLTESSDIVFHSNQFKNFSFYPNLKSNLSTQRNAVNFSFTPIPGTLIIFPSWLLHSTLPSRVDKRLSIAFNIIPKGEFGGDTAKLYL